jgi:ParB family chromosome partitioning protein
MAKIVEFKDIPLDDLEIGKAQVRLSDVGREINELADSINQVGLLEPIVVAPTEIGEKYEIILGQRRFLAHQELGLETIKAGILDGPVEEIEAKVLSVTENLVRRELNRKDLIDVCTYLYKQYASMRAVATETGLPYEKVREYVKYDRLIPELKTLVDGEGLEVKVALRAQDAAAIEGKPDSQEAVKLAKEMSGMSGAQQRKIQQAREENPAASTDAIIEQAKSGGKIIQIVVTLGQQAHSSLGSFAADEETTIGEAAAQLIEDGLSSKGYNTNGGME